jgi:hypothetical protein
MAFDAPDDEGEQDRGKADEDPGLDGLEGPETATPWPRIPSWRLAVVVLSSAPGTIASTTVIGGR